MKNRNIFVRLTVVSKYQIFDPKNKQKTKKQKTKKQKTKKQKRFCT